MASAGLINRSAKLTAPVCIVKTDSAIERHPVRYRRFIFILAVCLLLPAQDATRYAPVPLRALLPREIDNMLVRGKALSMDQDALNYARMAPDVMCVGYLAGRVAGM